MINTSLQLGQENRVAPSSLGLIPLLHDKHLGMFIVLLIIITNCLSIQLRLRWCFKLFELTHFLFGDKD